MSWLLQNLMFPWYLAGIAAISLPILFHMIRRMPKGQTAFSAVMFLSPSPPRLTKRSRVDNWLLLLLRALVLILLAYAFTRPFSRQEDQLTLAGGVPRRIVLLLDTSASMRRDGLWERAMDQIDSVLEGLKAADQVSLISFDSETQRHVPFSNIAIVAPQETRLLIREHLKDIGPSWAATDLGTALATAADALNDLSEGNALSEGVVSEEATDTSHMQRQIVLISDMQQGASLDALQAYHWPESVTLIPVKVASDRPTNASVQWLADRQQQDKTNETIAVRVANATGGSETQFELVWQDSNSVPISVHVPVGESRVVNVPYAKDNGNVLSLAGDDHDFDNAAHVVKAQSPSYTIGSMGLGEASDNQSLRFYLDAAFESTYAFTVENVSVSSQSVPEDLKRCHLLVATTDAIAQSVIDIRDYVTAGGHALLLANEQTPDSATDAAATVQQLMNDSAFTLTEVHVDDYRMLGKISFGHSLFQPFASSQFSDFTSIHFWKHRQVSFTPSENAATIASFENGDPAMIVFQVGEGRVIMFASGWHPDDSQMALSTKFVPLLVTILEEAAGVQSIRPLNSVDDSIVLPSNRTHRSEAVITGPDSSNYKLPTHATQFTETQTPGLYQFQRGEQTAAFVVSTAARESDTSPMPLDTLKKYGVRLTDSEQVSTAEQRHRQLRDQELERKQKRWQWVILAALCVLAAEIWLSGKYVAPAGSPTESTVATGSLPVDP